jgi:hypothetical protein
MPTQPSPTDRLGKSPLEQIGNSRRRWIASRHAEVFKYVAKKKFENCLPESVLFNTDGSGMICRTIMFSQVGFPTINRHQGPYPIPMFVSYPNQRG